MKTEQRPWLNNVYQQKKARTENLVKRTIDHLISKQQKITLQAIVKTSQEIDQDSKGISHSAILNNEQAYQYYAQFAKTKYGNNKRSKKKYLEKKHQPTKARLLQQYTKAELVDKLLKLQASNRQLELTYNTLLEKWYDLLE